MSDWNMKVIEEFRGNHGKVGGAFEGKPLLLLTTTGARTGEARVNPLMYLPDGERVVVFASKGGSPTHPDWFFNIKAEPTVTVEIGDELYEAIATEATDEERDDLYLRQSTVYPQFAEYQEGNPRQIPVVVLQRAE